MFRHVVLLKWTETATNDQIQAVGDRLSVLPEEIPELRNYVLGTDAGLNPDTFDFVAVADFDDEAGYLAYRDNPLHQQIIKESILPILANRAAVQHSWG